MYKPGKASLWIIVAVFALIITYLLVFVSVNDVKGLKKQIEGDMEYISYMEQELINKDFAYTACALEIENLEQVIAGKDELIVELQVSKEVFELYRETLEYCLLFIRTEQLRMYQAGITYTEFIFDSFLEDGYYESIEEQIEFFKSIEN